VCACAASARWRCCLWCLHPMGLKCVWGRVRDRYKEREKEKDKGREGKRECVCVCVRGEHTLALLSLVLAPNGTQVCVGESER